jgi:hypothetical protein
VQVLSLAPTYRPLGRPSKKYTGQFPGQLVEESGHWSYQLRPYPRPATRRIHESATCPMATFVSSRSRVPGLPALGSRSVPVGSGRFPVGSRSVSASRPALRWRRRPSAPARILVGSCSVPRLVSAPHPALRRSVPVRPLVGFRIPPSTARVGSCPPWLVSCIQSRPCAPSRRRRPAPRGSVPVGLRVQPSPRGRRVIFDGRARQWRSPRAYTPSRGGVFLHRRGRPPARCAHEREQAGSPHV